MSEPDLGGRPPLPDGQRRKRVITIRVSDTMYQALEQRVESEGCASLAQLVLALAFIGYTETAPGALRETWRAMLRRDLLAELQASMRL